MNNAQIVLASASPRRRELLDQIKVRYEALAVDVDENRRVGEAAEPYVLRVAAEKSRRGQELCAGKLPVLGADTVVALDDEVMGKPQNRAHALAMLSRLSGREHRVMSAVSIRAERHWQALNVSTVRFRRLEKAEMLAYWLSGEPRDKAGAYAIQGLGALFVAHLEGSFSGVMGLPLYETAQLLKKAGIKLL